MVFRISIIWNDAVCCLRRILVDGSVDASSCVNGFYRRVRVPALELDSWQNFRTLLLISCYLPSLDICWILRYLFFYLVLQMSYLPISLLVKN